MLLNEVPDTLVSLTKPPSDGSQPHDEDVKTWAKTASDYLSQKAGENHKIVYAKLIPPKKDDDALKTDLKKALKELYEKDEPYFLAVKCLLPERKGDIIHILAVSSDNILNLEQQQLKDKWRDICNKTFPPESGTPAPVGKNLAPAQATQGKSTSGKTAIKAEVLEPQDIQQQEFVSCPNVTKICSSTEFSSVQPSSELANQIQKIFSDKIDGEPKSVLYATLLPSQTDEKALEKSIGDALEDFLNKKPSIFIALKCGEENLIHILAAPPNDESWKPEEELNKWPDILEDLEKKDKPTNRATALEEHDKKTETPIPPDEQTESGELYTSIDELKSELKAIAELKSSIDELTSELKKNIAELKSSIEKLTSKLNEPKSFWPFNFKKFSMFITSVLFVLTLLGLFGYFVFFRDNAIQISSPDTNPDAESVSVPACDNERQPCENGKKWAVVFTNEDKKLPFEIDGTEVQFFESELDCKNNQESLDWRPYRTSVEPLAVEKQPRWAKILRGDEDLSDCAEGKEHSDTHRITFSFKSNQFEGKRKIVVIAPSVQLASNGIGRMIQDTLKKWLLDLKKKQTNVPVTILLIDPNEKVNTLIRSEDLNELPDERKNSITAKVNGIAFVSDSFRSVYELEQVDVALEGKDFDHVLYLTDGKSYSGSSSLSTSLKMALGIPWYWLSNGVSLSILTVGDCKFWHTVMSKAKCRTLDSQDKEVAQRRFKEMLGKLLPRY
jgi:molecular chaperone GrpE (heat shock protein)